MPIATVTRTVTLPDGTVKKTIEKLHKDAHGNVLRILSHVEEILTPSPPPSPQKVVQAQSQPPDDHHHHHAKEEKDDNDDYMIARLRSIRNGGGSSSISNNGGSSFDNPIQGSSNNNNNNNNTSFLSIPTIDSANKARSAYYATTTTTVAPSSKLDDPKVEEDFLIARLRNNSNNNGSSGSSNLSGQSALPIYSLRGSSATSNSGAGGETLIDHLRRVNLQNQQQRQQEQDHRASASARPSTGPSNVRREEESPLPAILVQAEPLMPSSSNDQCIYKTVTMENVLADGTVVVRTERHQVFADGSVRVLESRDEPVRVPVESVPQSPSHPSTTANHNAANHAVHNPEPDRVQASTVPPSTAAALPMRVHTSAPQTYGRPSAPASNSYGQLPTHLPAVVVSSSTVQRSGQQQQQQVRPQQIPPQKVQQQQPPNGGGGGMDRLEVAEGALGVLQLAHNVFGDSAEPADVNININIGDTPGRGQQQPPQQQFNKNGIGNALRWANVGLGAGQLANNLLGLNTEEEEEEIDLTNAFHDS
jgi:hypothetical protein